MNSDEMIPAEWVIVPVPPNAPSNHFWVVQNSKRAMFKRMGISPRDVVYCRERGTLEELGRPPAIRDMVAWRAAEYMAKGIFEALATDEEIARFHRERAAAQQLCADMTAAAKRETSAVMSLAFAEASQLLNRK
jgi:hypothetical protein